MFKAIRKAYERRRRPMHDHHYLVLPDIGLAYGRCPNSATFGIRHSLLTLSQRYGARHKDENAANQDQGQGGYATGTLDHWTDGLELLSARQLTRLHPNAFVFAAVRDPISRLAACYIRDLKHGSRIPASGIYYGFRADMSFTTFAARVCNIPDERSSNGYRSQASILMRKGRLVPHMVMRQEDGGIKWPQLRAAIEDNCRVDIGAYPMSDADEESEIADLVNRLDDSLIYALKQRYRADYALFYSNERAS